MARKKLNIQNPKRLNSTNHCLSGGLVIIEYIGETDKEYVYNINVNYQNKSSLMIDKTIENDEMVISFHDIDNHIEFITKPINFCNKRDQFLDWIIGIFDTELPF